MRIALALLLAMAPAFARAGDDVAGARESKHRIMPFVGYQYLNGEQRGVDYSMDIIDRSFPDTTFHFSGTLSGESDGKPPVLGIAYTYLLRENIRCEAALAVLQDQADFNYPVVLDFYGFLQKRDFTVHRSNTTWLLADVVRDFDTPLRWLTASGRMGVGLAWRDIYYSWLLRNVPGVAHSIEIKDADQSLTIRGGIDFSVWRSDDLLIQGGVTYTQFLPMSGDVDSFGGIGWRFSLFPIWSGGQE